MSVKTAWAIVGAAVAVGLGLYLSRGPWLMFWQQRSRASVAATELAKTEREKTSLMRERARLETPMGRQELAREQGYVKKGEESMTLGR